MCLSSVDMHYVAQIQMHKLSLETYAPRVSYSYRNIIIYLLVIIYNIAMYIIYSIKDH